MGDPDSVQVQVDQDAPVGEPNPLWPEICNTIRIISNNCRQRNIEQIKKQCENLTKNNTNMAEILEAEINKIDMNTPPDRQTRESLRIKLIDLIVTEVRPLGADDDTRLFLTAIQLNLDKLQEVIQQQPENINKTNFSDSVILFILKYGNIAHENFFECMRTLVDAGVDVNTFDFKGKFGIDYIASSYQSYKDYTELQKTLIGVAKLLLEKEIYKPDNKTTLQFLKDRLHIDIDNYEFRKMDIEIKLFFWMMTNNIHALLKCNDVKENVNLDNGEHTLLQIASNKTDNMLPVVKLLLKNGADPNKTTIHNSLSPLELAAKNNNPKIFEELLNYKETKITKAQFEKFVRWRSNPMRPKLFQLLLESDKVDPSFIYANTENTPLHYAILFSHKKAIQNLLRRDASLTNKNKLGKSALDIIDCQDLKEYFDQCLVWDNHKPNFTDMYYKMQFRFACLVDENVKRELRVVSKIGQHPNLEHLLTHPFIDTFVTLKWFKIKKFLYFFLLLQLVIFAMLSVTFSFLYTSWPITFFCVLFTVLNIVIKAPIFLRFQRKENNSFDFFVLNQAFLHGSLEIMLMVTTIGAFYQNQIRAFVFVEMAILLLLTAGYHPKLSKWSIMLQQVFKTFSILLIFFSIIVAAFGMGFHILFPQDGFFGNVFTSLFRTYIMTTGEFNIDKKDFETSSVGGYIFFVLFAMSMSLVIVNFTTGVAVTDIERIEKNSEVNATKNVVLFMIFVDFIYTVGWIKRVRNFLPDPLFFLRFDNDGKIYRDSNRCNVNFFVNKDNQFDNETDFPKNVDEECFEKIKSHYYNMQKVPAEEEMMMNKLEEMMSKMVAEIKGGCCKNGDNKEKKSEKKGP